MSDEELAKFRAEVVRNSKIAATPIDVEGLTRDGVIAPAKRGWYELLDRDRLPEGVGSRVVELESEVRGGMRRMLVKFDPSPATTKAAADLYRKLTGKSPTE